MKSIVRVLAVTVAVGALTPAVAHAGVTPNCGTVAFAPQSDNGAFQIVARSTSCGTARAVAAASRPSRFRHGDPRYSIDGFSCQGTGAELGGAGKYVVHFRCLGGRSSVSFLRG